LIQKGERAMNEPVKPEPSTNDGLVESLGHPRGTLAIVILYAILFALGWLAFYVLLFLPRGAPQP
jgi:hypothetical protein